MKEVNAALCPFLTSESWTSSEGYTRSESVTNVDNGSIGKRYFDEGLRLMLSFFFEEASKHFLACTTYSPHCALAHAMAAHCHGPSYNFTGEAYYTSNHDVDDDNDGSARQNCLRESGNDDAARNNKRNGYSSFPCQFFAEYHSALAMEKMQDLKKTHEEKRNAKKRTRITLEENTEQGDDRIEKQVKQQPDIISDAETQIIMAIRKRACKPGVESSLAEHSVGRPFADAMRDVYTCYPSDPEVAFLYADSLMVLNAWNLFDYPLGRELSEDVPEIRKVLEKALKTHPNHAGLCHLYIHLCEMSPTPEKALQACETLRTRYPDAGHLLHMPTHIDILRGDYEACVKYNDAGILADEKRMILFPKTTTVPSFYFNMIVHNYHMLAYGAILGAMEKKGMECALKLSKHLTEDVLTKNPNLIPALEAHATLDIDILVRFGRWQDILVLEFPLNTNIMMYRAASLRYARALAYANMGDTESAKKEATFFEQIMDQPETANRYLRNNSIADIFIVKHLMVKGEIEYFDGNHDKGFRLLEEAVFQQDNLNYDEPWGVMQPIRHALGGLLLKQGFYEEAEAVFREDLTRHPNNPWALVGLKACLKRSLEKFAKEEEERIPLEEECKKVETAFQEQRKSKWADYNVTLSCMCAKMKCCSNNA